MGKKKRGRKNTRAKEDEFLTNSCEQCEIVKKGVEDRGKKAREPNQAQVLSVAGTSSLTKFIRTPSTSGVSPVGILRIPEPGEYAVSSNGSPLLVTSSVTDTAIINIPLKNGKRIIISPNADAIPNAIRDNLDADVKTQLKLLLNTLSLILKEA